MHLEPWRVVEGVVEDDGVPDAQVLVGATLRVRVPVFEKDGPEGSG